MKLSGNFWQENHVLCKHIENLIIANSCGTFYSCPQQKGQYLLYIVSQALCDTYCGLRYAHWGELVGLMQLTSLLCTYGPYWDRQKSAARTQYPTLTTNSWGPLTCSIT